MLFTEPLLTCVVSADHSADCSGPRRTSLPSIKAMSPLVAELASDHTAAPVDSRDIISMVPNTMAVRRRRPVNGVIMKITDIGISRMPNSSSRLENGVGFSSGVALLGPYQPPPLEPNCLAATIGATGPKGIFCSFIATLASSGVVVGPACNVAGTPCAVSNTAHSRHKGSMKRSEARVTSTQ